MLLLAVTSVKTRLLDGYLIAMSHAYTEDQLVELILV